MVLCRKIHLAWSLKHQGSSTTVMIQQCPSYNFSHGPSDVAAERISQIESGNRSPLCITEVKIEGLHIPLMLEKNSKMNIEKSSRGPEIKCVISREPKIFESGGRNAQPHLAFDLF